MNLCLYLNSIDWNNILSESVDVDVMWNCFMDVVQFGIEKFVPLKQKLPVPFTKYPPHILQLQAKKSRLWRLRRRTGFVEKYNKISIKCKKVIEKFHADQELSMLDMDSKRFYRHLNNKLNSHKSVPVMFDDLNHQLSSDIDKANGFINEFQKSFTVDDGTLPQINDPTILHPFSAQPDFSLSSIEKHLKLINNSAAAGPDSLPGIFWHSLSGPLSIPLSKIFNVSFKMGHLP
jgi:hypothetical protein